MAVLKVQDDSLSRGEDTFTPDRLHAHLRNERFSYEYRTNPEVRAYSTVIYDSLEVRCEIDTNFFEMENHEDGIRCFNDHDTKQRAVKFCQDLYEIGTSESVSVTNLDATFSKIFKFKFEPVEDSEAIVEKTTDLLERLPARPLELAEIPPTFPPRFSATSVVNSADDYSWETLQVTTFVDSNVLRAALSSVMDSGCASSLLDTIDVTATLLEIISQHVSAVSDDEGLWRSFTIRAFLWTSWQRLQMIYYHLVSDAFLRHGSSDGKTHKLTMRGTFPSPGMTIHELSKQRANLQKSPYMCGWNFEVLRTNPVCIGADFRRFHQRFNSAFGDCSGRCLPGKASSCKGDSPKSCRRFQGMIIEDQSMHDESCIGDCRRLTWDEMSYRAVTGARAVSIARTVSCTNQNLQYCNASDRTLAISHVWSHGQGGRPEDGINYCLHLRYTNIARSLGCESYWIDTTCIPNDHQLRAESIAKINDVFLEAKVMLVCDRDLMEIDISDMTTTACERMLVTAIASDWNVRAWTFFEAFRARRSLQILCRNNAVVPLKQVIDIVHRKGALEIGNLLLASPHFLPSLNDRELARSKSKSRQEFEEGHLAIELSGSLLSHRAASRPGDDFVIWSLLMSEKYIFYSAEDFWKSMQGEALQSAADTGDIFSSAATISTGFLVSSAPRLKEKGLTWAPASPALHTSTNVEKDSYNGYDGGHSYRGLITKEGLVADWLLYKFDGCSFWLTVKSLLFRLWGQDPACHCPQNLARIRAKYLIEYRWGAILCPIQDSLGPNWDNWWEEGGRMRRTVVAVCATNQLNGPVAEKYTFNNSIPTKVKWDHHREVAGWQWRGTYVWDDSEPLPPLHRAKKLLIE